MGCTGSNTNNSRTQNNLEKEQSTQKNQTNNNNKNNNNQNQNQINKTNDNKKNVSQQQHQDIASLNSKATKIMTLVSGQKDYYPRDQFYLKNSPPVKIPLGQSKSHSSMHNPLYKLPIKQKEVDFSKYKVPKVTYPKLDLSNIYKNKQNPKVEC